MYVASGLCNSAPTNTTYTATTASNTIYKVDLSTGMPSGDFLADYGSSSISPGNTPVSKANVDDNYIMVVVQIASVAQRVEKVAKVKSSLRPPFTSGTAVFAASTLRTIVQNTDGFILIANATKIDKFSSYASRLFAPPPTASSTPFVVGGSLVGNCASSANNIFGIAVTTSGKIIYTHSNALQNRVGVISSTGYATAADCLCGLAAPTANAFPTAVAYLPNYNKVLVLYAGTTAVANQNSIYAYDFDDTTGALTAPILAFQDTNVLYGGSAMTFDSTTGKIYIATGNSNAATILNYNIEQFTFDPTTKLLARVGTVPFASGWIGSHCISSMFISN